MLVQPPNRAKHTYIQHLCAPPAAVFPLLGPVRETEWVPGWMPVQVLSHSGVAEPGCVFVTPAEPHDAIWIITRHDPAAWQAEMIKVTPEHTVAKLEIALSPGAGDTSEARISYEFTAIGKGGDAILREFSAEWYRDFMVGWETALNHFLLTGVVKAFIQLRPGHNSGPQLETSIREFVKTRLSPHEYPRAIEFVDGFPMTATGKIRRKALREREVARGSDAE